MQLPEHAAHAIRRLERAGFEAWAVGGCVRDSLRGVPPHDWDLCTSASPAQMQAVFADARVLTTGLKHGTLTVLTDGGPLEITTYRTEGGYSDGRHPDGVRFVTDIREDLARRDFTVGAMAWHPERGLCDPFGGQTDLKNGVLRAVGDADTRFQEDALRILRGLRFASKLGFAIEPETAAAMRRQVHRLDCIAAERIREELTGLLCGRYVQRTLMAYADLITSALPELAPMQGCQQQNPHHLYDVWEHTLHAMEKVKPEPELRLTMLLHDIGKPNCFTVDGLGCGHFYGHPAESARMAEAMLGRLRAETVLRETVVQLVAWHDRNIPRTRPGVARALGALGERDLRRLLDVQRADNLAQAPAYRFLQGEIDRAECILDQLLVEGACVSLRQLAVNGRDLLAMGLSGPAVGQTLRELLNAVLDDSLPNERHALLAAVRDRAHRS